MWFKLPWQNNYLTTKYTISFYHSSHLFSMLIIFIVFHIPEEPLLRWVFSVMRTQSENTSHQRLHTRVPQIDTVYFLADSTSIFCFLWRFDFPVQIIHKEELDAELRFWVYLLRCILCMPWFDYYSATRSALIFILKMGHSWFLKCIQVCSVNMHRCTKICLIMIQANFGRYCENEIMK